MFSFCACPKSAILQESLGTEGKFGSHFAKEVLGGQKPG